MLSVAYERDIVNTKEIYDINSLDIKKKNVFKVLLNNF